MPESPKQKGEQYKPGELEVILRLPPTHANIRCLSRLLERSEGAISIVYQIAYGHGPFGKHGGIQERKILAAKKAVGIAIGRSTPRRQSSKK